MLGICQECRKKTCRIEIHHKDGNHNNDIESNRKDLCSGCHHKAHVEMRRVQGLPLGTRPISERLPVGYKYPSVGKAEIRRQYFICFPRV